jgi:hypothetical protein
MKCPKCSFENPETNQVCGKCGQMLVSPSETETADPEYWKSRLDKAVRATIDSIYVTILLCFL